MSRLFLRVAVAAALLFPVIVLALLAVPSPAFAAVGGTVVDFAPVVSSALELLAPVLLAVTSFAVHRVAGLVSRRIGVSIDQATEDRLNAGLNKAIGYGLSKATTAAVGRTTMDVKSEALAHAAGYAIAYFPSLLDHFDIKPETLAARLEARLAEHPAAAVLK